MDRRAGASGIISILTDFGTSDGYVAAMKGVILSINRSATIVDVSHEVRPQDVYEGAFVLHTMCGHFPPRTVHLAVVDPEVGTDRAGLAVDTRDAVFVVPDNGLLSFVLAERGERANHGDTEGTERGGVTGRRGDRETGGGDAGHDDVGRGPVPRHPEWEGEAPAEPHVGSDSYVRPGQDVDSRLRGNDDIAAPSAPRGLAETPAPTGGEGTQSSALGPQSLFHHSLPPGWRAVRLAEPRFWLPEVSNTFHGRDIFAPVAAHLSLGEPLDDLGPEVTSLLAFPVPLVVRLPDGTATGAVIHVDRFGNLITNFRRSDLPSAPAVVELGGERIAGLSRTYAGAAGLAALVGSSGYLEIALPGGSAHAATGLGTGSEVRVVPER